MSLPVKPQIFCSLGKGIPERHVRAKCNIKYSRKANDKYECRIESVWREKMKENVTLYNKSKFRLRKAQVENFSDRDHECVVLLLGLTNYKEFIGTNCAPYGVELMNQTMIGDLPYEHHYLANPLGVGAIVETADSKIVLLGRSHLCAESPGLIDMPGGHPEPDDVNGLSAENFNDVDSSSIVHEIFHSISREVQDEVNIPATSLSEPLLLGICFNEKTLYRASAEFYIKCSLTSDEVLLKYQEQTQPEKEESTNLVFLDSETFKDITKLSVSDVWSNLTSSARDGAQLFSIFCP